MKTIVHFGMHKTGSSSIQLSLHRNLSDPRFYYARFEGSADGGTDGGSGNHSGRLMVLFKSNPAEHHGARKTGAGGAELERMKERFVSRLDREIARAEGRTLILSGEGVSALVAADLERMREFLTSRGCECTAVGYVRPPKAFIESAFQQIIKAGGVIPRLEKTFPSYSQALALDDVFGRTNVHFWPFEPKSFPGKDVVLDFCRRLDITFPAEASVRVNEGISLSALKLLYCYRKLGPGYGSGRSAVRENDALVAALQPLTGPKVRLHSRLVAPLLKQNEGTIRAMEARLGASLLEDLEDGDDSAIRNEDELLVVDDETTYWLAQQLGPRAEQRWKKSMSPQAVADWMHALRVQLSGDAGATKGAVRSPPRPSGGSDNTLGVDDIVASVRRALPALEQMTDQEFALIIIAALEAMRNDLDGIYSQLHARAALRPAGDAPHRAAVAAEFQPFGRFLARSVVAQAAGSAPRVRVTFKPGTPRLERQNTEGS